MLKGMSIPERISDRLAEIQGQIKQLADDRPVTLVAVSKYASIEQMREAYAAGIRHFGENKVQDALAKIAAFPPADYPNLQWHLIGNLQSNKVKKTIDQFALIHAIDSIRLAEALSVQAMAAGQRQAILLQVNLSEDPSRHGFLPEDVPAAVAEILGLPGVQVRGLMGMAPPEASLSNDQVILRRVFGGLRDLKAQVAEELGIDLPELSMGMSHDYTHALQCGATIIRLGNSLFKT